MTSHKTLDQMTSNDLDRLYQDLKIVTDRACRDSEDLARTKAERDSAYRERAHLVALLAAMTDGAVIAPAPDVDEPGWQIVYLRLGGWQASWHIAPRDAELFTRVEQVAADDPRAQWDGHTTDQKYTRIRTHTSVLQLRGQEPYDRCLCPSTQAGLELCARCPGHDATPGLAATQAADAGHVIPVDGDPAAAHEAVRQMDADTTQPHTGLVVQPYTDHGLQRWVFRCWGTSTCDGLLSLDHTSQQWAERARDRHVREEHSSEEQPMSACTATIEGPHIPGGPVHCTREAGHPENHTGLAPGTDGKLMWNDHHAGATPHQASSEEQR